MRNILTSVEKSITIAVVLLLVGTPLFDVQNATGNSSEGYSVTQYSTDLSIESVIPDKTHVIINERINVTVTVINDGDEDARWVDMHYKINGEEQYYKSIEEINPGASENETFVFQPDTKGKFTLTFVGKDDGVEFDSKSVDIFVEIDTIYVDDDAAEGGNGSHDKPYKEIQQAVDNATSGDLIIVFNGTYQENVLVDVSVSIIGNHSSNTTIQGSGTGDVVRITSDGVLFKGFTVLNSEKSDDYAGISAISENSQIKDNNCSGNNIGILVEGYGSNQMINNTCSNNDRSGISLRDTNSNEISDNYCHENINYGISLTRSGDNLVKNNTIICETTNEDDGISLYESGGNRISNNLIENSDRAIRISYFDRNRIDNNICANNSYGIYISESSLNTIEGNLLLGNVKYDVSLYESEENTVRENTMERGIRIKGDTLEQWNTHNIDTTNMVRGKPVYYLKDSSNLTVPLGVSQVILAKCDWVVIENLEMSNVPMGILLGYSSHVKISNNTISSTMESVYLCRSDYNTISQNTLSNSYAGLFLSESNYNTISSNKCINNIRSGMEIEDESNYNTFIKNTCSNNTDAGIDFENSGNNDLQFNTVTKNRYGMVFETECEENVAHHNNIMDNEKYGILVGEKDSRIVDATDNWWGSTSGPYHEDDNPAGNGDEISDYVKFDPWLTHEISFNTYYVTKYGNDTTGNGTKENPFLTIQKAVDESNDWDAIRVFEGVYEENVVVNNKGVQIIGNGSGETVIQGFGAENGNSEEHAVSCYYKGGFGGAYRGVVYEGGYLYAAHFQGLSIFNVSAPSNPKEIGFIHTVGNAYAVAVSGGYAYVLDYGIGLIVMNVSDPNDPQYMGGYDTAGNSVGVAVSGGYAYIADKYNGLVVVDVRNPTDPLYAGRYETAASAEGVAVSGGFAYVADLYNGLVVVNVSDPTNPQFTGGYDTSGQAYGVAVSGGYAYVADSSNGLVIVNVSDPTNPQYDGGYDTQGSAYSVTVSGGYAYVADYHGLVVVDVSDPATPQYAGTCDTTGYAYSVAVAGDYAYVTDLTYGLFLVDITDRADPMQVGHIDTASEANGVVVCGDYAYVADGDNGLVVVDISNPRKPQFTGRYDTARKALDVALSGEFAYVADRNNGLVVVDVSDPTNPQFAGGLDSDAVTRSVVVSGDYAYVADGNNGLVVVDVSDPTNPQYEGGYDTNGKAYGVAVSGEYAYIADYRNGLVVLDVSDPKKPHYAGGNDTAGEAYGIAVSGGYAFIADEDNGLVIMDVSNPRKPQYTSRYDTGGDAYDIAVSGGYAYVSDGHSGLVVLDVSDITDPQFVAKYNTAGIARDVAVSGRHVYVADEMNGLAILELHFPPDSVFHLFADFTRITDLTIRNGSRAGILIDANNVEIAHCQITGNNDGIRFIDGKQNIVIRNCDIFENKGFGIHAFENNDKAVNATNNWWGDPSGPFHPTSNPEGIGNEVSDYVNFEPWLSRPFGFKVHHVAPGGNDTTGTGDENSPYRTIQKAIEMVHEWDTIVVAPGTYSESITVNKRNVTIIGDSPDTTIIDAGEAETTCTITADNVEINSFTIKNGIDNGILFTNSSGNRIVNCVFPDNSYDLNLTYSKNNRLINTTFETVNFNDPNSSISVLWPVDLKVTDNRSGFIPNAHLKITDGFGTVLFDGNTDEIGYIPQMLLLDYYQNISSQIDYNPYTIGISKDGYLDLSEEYLITSYTRFTCQLQDHILPVAVNSGGLVQHIDMDSEIFFDGSMSTGRSISYFWEFGDTTSSTFPTPSHTYTVPGAYQVNLTVTDDYENTSTASIVVIVENVQPVIVAGVEKNTAFEDEQILFDASFCWDTPSDSLTFLWDFGDGSQTDKSVVSHAFQSEGYFMATLTTTDRHGSKNTSTHYINVSNQAPWDVSAGEDISAYTKETVEFQGSAMDTISDFGSLQYSWSFGEGTGATGQNVSFVYSESGVYEVHLTVKDNNNASTYALVNVTVKDPEILLSVSSYQIFQDETVFFNASHELDDGSFNFSLHFGDGYSAEGQNVTHIFNKVEIFTPWLIVNDGMENTTIFLQEITVQNVVPIAVIQADKLQVSEDETVQFDASGSLDSASDLPILAYSWDFVDGSNSAGIEVIHAFPEMGNYTVKLTVSDGKTTGTTEVQIDVQNLPPVADAGIPKERKTTVGEPVILDASGTTDTPSDINELNYTWKIGNDTVYGEVVSYIFSKTGEFTVSLIIQDNNGASSEDTITFQVSKESESDDAAMNTISWILVVVIVVFLVVIGFLLSGIRDETLYREMKAEEETIVVEGEIDEESFKPKDYAQGTTVEVFEEQDLNISDSEVEVVGGEINDEMFKPKGNDQESRVELEEGQEVEISNEDIEVVKEPEIG